MQCYNCERVYSDFLGFCPYCGMEKKEFNICGNCGKKILKEFDTCPDCGFKTIEENFEMESERLNQEGLKSEGIDDSKNFFNESLKFNENNLDAWKNKASLFLDYSYPKSIKACDAALKIDEDNLEILLIRAKAMSKCNKISDEEKESYFRDLLKKCDERLKTNPLDDRAWAVKGETLGRLNQKNERIECYYKALEINPSNKEYWSEQALNLYIANDYENEIKCYHKILELNPNDYEIYGKIADRYQHYLDDNKKALKYYTKALELKPDAEYLWDYKARLLDEMGLYEESVECYDKVIRLRPEYDNYILSKAKALNELGRLEDAIDCYDEALKIHDAPHTREYKSDLLIKLKRYDEALKNYDEALKNYPDYDRTYILKGQLLNKMERYEEEIKTYDELIEKDDHYPLKYYKIAKKWKGVALSKLDKEKSVEYFNELLSDYDTVLEIFPEDGEEWDNKGDILYYLEKYDESIECYKKALKDDKLPNRLDVLATIGKIYYELKDYDEAIIYLDKALEINPDVIFVLEYKGYCLEELGKYDEALVNYDKIVYLDSNQEEIELRRKELMKKVNS